MIKLYRISKILLLVILSLAAVCFLNGCAKKKPIRIGFVAHMFGPQSDIGVQFRNGSQLAVDDINASGGIDGRPIELIVRDDKGTPEGVRAVDRELIKEGVVAIIGHDTSALTKVAIPVTDAAHMVLISPGSASSELNRMSHYYFRVNSGVDERTSDYAHYIYQDRDIKQIGIIYDTDNAALSQSYMEQLVSAYKRLGGKVDNVVAFSSKTKPNFGVLIKKLRNNQDEGLFIIAGSMDSALIAQRTRQIGWNVPLFCSFWPDSEMLMKFGGKAVEGITIEGNYDLNNKSPEFLGFVARYKAKYGTSFVDTSARGYETVQILATALKKTGGNAKGLRQALLETKNYKGVMDTISFDKHGGAVRPLYIEILRGGKIKIYKLPPPYKQLSK